SFSNSFTATFSSTSDFSVSFAELLDLADFTLVAIITKIIKTNAEKAFARKGFYRKLVQRNDVSLKKGIALTKFVIIWFLLFFTGWASAQTAADSNSVDVSMIRE